MELDEEQVGVDVDFLKSQPEWQSGDQDQRRTWLRDVAIKSLPETDPELHGAVMGRLWGELDDRGLVERAADFTGTAVKEVVKSIPALGGAAALAVTDAVNLTDSGSGVRLARGVADLASGTVQRVKSLDPDDYQERRDTALDALKTDLDKRAYPDRLEDWLHGDDSAIEDEETRGWVEGLTNEFAKQAVRAEHGDNYTPEQVQRYLESDRNPAATRSMAEEFGPGPRVMLADYLATKDPRSWEAFRQRVSETDTQINTRLANYTAGGELRETLAKMEPGGMMQDLTKRGAEMQGSPIDLAASAFPFLKGARALQAARAGSRGRAVWEGVKAAVGEGLGEAATEALMDPNAPTSQVVEAGAMGTLGGAAVGGTGAAMGEVMNRFSGGAPEGESPAAPGVTLPAMPDGTGLAVQGNIPISNEDNANTIPEQPAGAAAAVPEAGAEAPVPAPLPDAETVQVPVTGPLSVDAAYWRDQGLSVEGVDRAVQFASDWNEQAASLAANGVTLAVPEVGTVRDTIQQMVGPDPLAVRLPDATTAEISNGKLQASSATAPVQPGVEPGSGLAEGPGASGVEEWRAPKFGERLKANNELKASWRQSFDPGQYKRRTEVEWGDQAAQWIDDHGISGASEMVFDPDSGVEPSDRVVLAGVLLDRVDAMATDAEKGGRPEDAANLNSLAADLATSLALNGSKAGQEVRAYGYLVKRSPAMILRNFERDRGEAITQDLETKLQTTQEALKQDVEATVREATSQARSEEGRRVKAREKSTVDDRVGKMVDRYAVELSDTLTGPDAMKRRKDALMELVRQYLERPFDGFQPALESLMVQPANAAALKSMLDEQRRRVEGIRVAKVEERKRETAQRTADSVLDGMAAELSDTPPAQRQAVRNAVRDLVRAYLERPFEGFQERLQGLGVKESTVKQLQPVLDEQLRREAAIDDAMKRQTAAEAPEKSAEGIVNRLASELSDTPPAQRQKVQDEVKRLAAEYLKKPSADLEQQLVAAGVKERTAAQMKALLDEQLRRVEVINEAKRRQAEAERPNKDAQRMIDRMAEAFSDTPGFKARTQNALRDLAAAHLAEPMEDFTARAEALGVDAVKAEQLRGLLEEQRKRVDAVAREKAGQALIKKLQDRVKVTPKVKSKVPRLVEDLLAAMNNGVLGRPEFLEAYARAFEMPELTTEVRQRIRALAHAAQVAPEGALKAEAVNALNNELSMFSGLKTEAAIIAAAYANVLSGATTQGINIVGNLENLIMKQLVVGLLNNPRDTMGMIMRLAKSTPRGLHEAWNALKGGTVYKGAEKYGSVDALAQLSQMKGPKTIGQKFASVISLGGLTRYGLNALNAADALIYNTTKESRYYLAAARAARAKGLKAGTPEFQKAIQEELGEGTDAWMQALDQAATDLRAVGKAVNRSDQLRRAWEILEQKRPLEARAEASRYGDLATYQQEPAGSGKLLYDLAMMVQQSKLGGVPGARFFVPFAKIVANMWSNGLDYTPVGIVRGLKGNHVVSRGEQVNDQFADWERRERFVQGVLGTTLVTGLGAVAYGFADMDDESVPFMIYGAGPGDNRVMPKGWKPYSIKVNGKYISLADTPLAMALAPVGALLDLHRYKKSYNERGLIAKAGYAGAASVKALFRQGVLSSLSDLMKAVTEGGNWDKIPSRVVLPFVPAQGLMRDVVPLFDPTKIADDTVMASIFRDVPVLRNVAGRPMVNILGEEVVAEGGDRVPLVKRLGSRQQPHEVIDWLVQNKLTVSKLPETIEVGQYLSKGEREASGLYERREVMASELNRVSGGQLTAKEGYQFAKQAGTLLKGSLKELKKTVQEEREKGKPVDLDWLQRQVDASVSASRRMAMRELVEGL